MGRRAMEHEVLRRYVVRVVNLDDSGIAEREDRALRFVELAKPHSHGCLT
jgi:hypothetical protein